MAGLMEMQSTLKRQSEAGIAGLADIQNKNNIANEGIKAANKAAKISSITTGAGLGMGTAMAMGAAAGPVGWAVLGGAAAGYLMYEFM